MSKSELKRDCVMRPLEMAERMAELESTIAEQKRTILDMEARGMMTTKMLGKVAHALIHANEKSVCNAAPHGRYVETLTEYESYRVSCLSSTSE